MIELGSATEDEMVLAFLQGEIDSPRFGPIYQSNLAQNELNRAAIVDQPDITRADHNQIRLRLLGVVRGYRNNQYLFVGFPQDVRWRRVMLEPGELARLMYANHPTWVQLSGGTRLVGDGAANIGRIPTAENANVNVTDVVAALEQGHRYPALIAITDEAGNLVLVEGHTRATAYAFARFNESVEVLVGSSPGMRNWVFY